MQKCERNIFGQLDIFTLNVQNFTKCENSDSNSLDENEQSNIFSYVLKFNIHFRTNANGILMQVKCHTDELIRCKVFSVHYNVVDFLYLHFHPSGPRLQISDLKALQNFVCGEVPWSGFNCTGTRVSIVGCSCAILIAAPIIIHLCYGPNGKCWQFRNFIFLIIKITPIE